MHFVMHTSASAHCNLKLLRSFLKLLSMFPAASLTALFKHIGSTDDRNAEDLNAWESLREKVLCFIRDKVRYILIW